MKISSDVFEAFLKCPTKGWLRAAGEQGSGNSYAEWVKLQSASYRATQTERLLSETPADESAVAPPPEVLKAAKWRLVTGMIVQAQMNCCTLEAELHAIEIVPSEGRGRPAQFVPIRFIFTNKHGQDDKWLSAFDAFVLSEVMRREISVAKIVHGDDHATVKVNIPALALKVRKHVEKITALIPSPSPPDLVLKRHCTECEFQARCRQKAIETDDLSLLASMSAKDRQKLRSKGIFTVTQLSYTFRPRRRPKRMRDKREKYHHSLKALAIREKKIHIVGSPKLKIEGMPVYLDVEGLPDRDFYYLIGVRIGNGESAVQHNLWADTAEEEGKIWREFLGILETAEMPMLVHYGSYETTFLKRMCERYGGPPEGSNVAKAVEATVDILSFIFAQIYMPTYSNSLKHVATHFGFRWSEPDPSGINAIVWHHGWTLTGAPGAKAKLVKYNQEDCDALARTTSELQQLCSNFAATPGERSQEVVDVGSLRRDAPYHLGKAEFAIPDFKPINQAAYWDYQTSRVRIRNRNRAKAPLARSARRRRWFLRPNKQVEAPTVTSCPSCTKTPVLKTGKITRLLQDLKFFPAGIKRCLVEYVGQRYRCPQCGARFIQRPEGWPNQKEGLGLLAYVVYQLIEHRVSQRAVADSLMELFGLDRHRAMVNRLKARAACIYRKSCMQMMDKLIRGSLIHADETDVSIGGERMYVWVFSNSEETVFYSTQTREGDFPKKLLSGFKGVLVSDFYPAYDSIPCTQQKCLIHLMRDLNNDLLKSPFDQELRSLAFEFAGLLKPMVETIDRFGLKTRFLKRHKTVVARFYRDLADKTYQSDMASKYRDRFQKEQERLFVFLDHDGVPWNNNSAEHAIKSFAMLRKAIGGSSTEAGIADYLVLLSVLEACKCKGVSFLGFLRAGETDIQAFADSRLRRRQRSGSGPSAAVKSAAASLVNLSQTGS